MKGKRRTMANWQRRVAKRKTKTRRQTKKKKKRTKGLWKWGTNT
jgi:hypothetical protein